MAASSSRTAELAAYCAGLEYGALPAEVATWTKRVLADTVGVLLGSSHTPALEMLAQQAFSRSYGGEATVVGWAQRTTPEQAAFINGVGGHHIELDDSHGPSLTHPAAVLVPAALAAGELAQASGKDLLTALVAGYDVLARVSKAIGVAAQYERGFHPSSVCGTIGAAACAASLLSLDAHQTRVALGLAASESCGLLTWEDDPSHLTKSYQTGLAARNGLHAAMVASAGYGGALDALDGRYSAIKAFGGDAHDATRLTEGLGEHFEIMDTDLKRFASCRHTHAALDGLLDILTAEGVAPAEIEAVDVELSHGAVPIVDANPLWTHNIQFVLALGAYQRNILPEHFTEQWTTDASALALAERVTLSGSDELQQAFPEAKGAVVRVRTAGGEFRRDVPEPMGHPSRPLTDDVFDDKFLSLSSPPLSKDQSAELRRLIDAVEDLPRIDPLMQAVRPQA